jgi:hypothetical protein
LEAYKIAVGLLPQLDLARRSWMWHTAKT